MEEDGTIKIILDDYTLDRLFTFHEQEAIIMGLRELIIVNGAGFKTTKAAKHLLKTLQFHRKEGEYESSR